jgi:hypothetical protein
MATGTWHQLEAVQRKQIRSKHSLRVTPHSPFSLSRSMYKIQATQVKYPACLRSSLTSGVSGFIKPGSSPGVNVPTTGLRLTW